MHHVRPAPRMQFGVAARIPKVSKQRRPGIRIDHDWLHAWFHVYVSVTSARDGEPATSSVRVEIRIFRLRIKEKKNQYPDSDK